MPINSVAEILDELARGRMVVVMDDEDRENEGDLLMAASLVRPEDINFMARYGRGLICLTLTRERCKQLALPLMVQANNAAHSTNFTVSVEAAEGVTTGISAYDRAHTVRTAVRPDARPEDLVQPGHVFPLMAKPGGVLTRAGHTEAGCDLASLAGLEPAAVIVEILNEDGSMARRPELESFAARHDLKMGTIADLISYRMRNETTVRRVAECQVPTEFGDFLMVAYEDELDGQVHLALIRGRIRADQDVLVRVHLPDLLRDMLAVSLDDGSRPLRASLRRISEEGAGIVVVLARSGEPRELIRRVRAMGLRQDSSVQPQLGGSMSTELRTYGVGAQILKDLGVRRMRVLSAPKRMQGISGFGLEVVDYVS
jgi:3,4-dihydroxy 2-butanone 4-phosphate synthase/GTP cyclohydrolase II